MRQASFYLDENSNLLQVKCPQCDKASVAVWYTWNDLDLASKEDMAATGMIEEISVCDCGCTSLITLRVATGTVSLDPIPHQQILDSGRSHTDQYSN